MLDHRCTSTDGRPTRLTSAPGAEFGPDRSPDGEQLTYVEASNPTQRAVMIMNACQGRLKTGPPSPVENWSTFAG